MEPRHLPTQAQPPAPPTRRRRWRLASIAAAMLAALAATSLTAPASAATTRYVFTAFTNASESNMYVYTSSDGLNFRTLRANAYTPPSGLVRDPSVIKAPNGYYYIVYTQNWTGSSFGVARSRDLLSWSYVTTVRVGVPGTQLTWAPEFFVDTDRSINVIVSLSPNALDCDCNFRPYRLRVQNSTFTSWSAATPLSGQFAGRNYIDTFVVRYNGAYHAFAKNETTKYIEHATSANFGGPYTFVGTGDWAGWGRALEGPSVVRLDNGTWRIFMDGYTQRRYFYADSRNLNSFGAKREIPGGLSSVLRHGTVLHDTI